MLVTDRSTVMRWVVGSGAGLNGLTGKDMGLHKRSYWLHFIDTKYVQVQGLSVVPQQRKEVSF